MAAPNIVNVRCKHDHRQDRHCTGKAIAMAIVFG
jgi:hypothetical protein